MRSILVLAVLSLCACVQAPPETSTSAAALVECNPATLGQSCDTDDEVCSVERCQLVGGQPTCVATGDAVDGTVCESDGDGCTVDTCGDGVCFHDEAPWCAPDAGPDEMNGDPDVIAPDPDPAAAPDAGPEPEPEPEPGSDAGIPFEGDIGGGGIGCSTSSPTGGVMLVLCALALVRRRRVAAIATLAFGFVVPAHAQGVDTTVYRPASPGAGGFAAESAAALPSGAVDLGLWFDVARDVLIVRDPDTGEIVDHGTVIGARSTVHLTAAVGLPAGIELGAALPLVLDQSGDLTMVGGGALPAHAAGDLALRAKLHLASWGGLRLALAGLGEIPLGEGDTFTHDPGPVVAARLLAGASLGRTELSLALGRRWREQSMLGNLTVDDEWVAEAGARVAIVDRRVWLAGDVYVAAATSSPAERQIPAEAIAGVRARVTGPWIAQAGVGVGLTHGYGTPSLRGLAMLAWSPERGSDRRLREVVAEPETETETETEPEPEAEAEAEPETEGDHDVVVDQDVLPPEDLVIRRFVLEDRVLFDTARARVKRSGKKLLDAVMAEWAAHPEWDRVVLEGHTDERGGDDYNLWLGEERATRVRDVLVDLGADPARLDVTSHGKTRPRSEVLDENRRVELVVLRRATK